MKVLYIDELLLVNFAAGAAFLLAAGLLAGVRCSGPRLAAGAALGAASCLVLLAPALPLPAALAYKAAAGAGTVALAYGWPGARVFLRLCGWYVALNLVLAGAAGLVPSGHAANLTAYLDITPGRLLAASAGVYLAVRGLLGFLGRPGGASVPAVLEVAGAQAGVLAFCDSGFTLADPVSGRAVVLVRYGAVRDALPEEAQAVLEAAFAGQAPEGPALGLRYLVCGTIAGRTLLPALPGAALTRRAGRRCWRETGLLAAFCPGGAEEGWTVLLGSELAGRMGL
ncbi:MAG TPA: sigma-E processing peptidase SpoIIGA [Candidatus Faecalibacterium faecigallinarum]|uniref:Sigma-E processing peptidase SpoIIGA n=1 Tax=Candidatus Faecalibacterium faecigallinarum TaxID=2838577 RepID=A0A9D2P7I1_9FIRM|nr:sigma-E processing peptidase SpoIIGA [Candidatus Faecalibacterium faecigallinarum]